MKQRDYYFDNGKFLLIFFVVFGHLITPFIGDNSLILAVYQTIFSFHMPAFIMISGHFSKYSVDKKRFIKLVKQFLVPYVLFQFIYTIYYYFLLDEKSVSIEILQPEWSLWFLISLFCWNIMLPFFTKMKKPVALTIAFALGLLIGHVHSAGSVLSISRTFVFFPFFLFGYYMKKEDFTVLKSKANMLIAISLILMVFTFFYHHPEYDYQWFYGSIPYSAMKLDAVLPELQRLFTYLLNFLMTFAFFTFVPEKKYSFTNMGKYTLYVYLLHGFIIKYFRETAWIDWFKEKQQFWILSIIALLLSKFLTSKMIRTLMQPFIELKAGNWKNLWKVFRKLTS